MEKGLRILIVEDLPSDAELAERELRKDGIHFTSIRVDTKDEFLNALEEFRPDLIISDYSMPEFDGIQALKLSLAHDPYLPFIVLTGSMNEETAVACMKAGATDYIIKEHITRIPLAVRGAIENQKIRREQKESENELVAIYENTPLIMMLIDGEGRIHKANECAAAFSGRSTDALLQMRYGEALRCLHSLDSPEGCGFGSRCKECTIRRCVTETIETGRSHHDEEGSLSYKSEHGEGKMIYLLSAKKLNFKKQPLVLLTILEITERRQAEDDLKKTLEIYRALAANIDSMYLVDTDCTYLFVNEGYRKRFNLSAEKIIGKRYREFHSEEDARQFAEEIAAVCKTGAPSIIEYRSERDEKFFLRTFTPITGQNSDEKISQVAVIAKDITDMKLSEQTLQDTLESLRKAVGTTIQVMVSAVETRDPYTSGHQTRSADLARAIAVEMELPQDKIDAIRMAGSIHDIGKLSIPAEILSKPTKLSEIEFSLIKEHARKGSEMLKDVESPWPLAEIVRQHHERIDGSGYPGNLKGEEICIEARILAIADTVEAMASHRPYRPGLGIDIALEEIEKNKGILYDSAAADACLRLFREKGFQLEGINYDR